MAEQAKYSPQKLASIKDIKIEDIEKDDRLKKLIFKGHSNTNSDEEETGEESFDWKDYLTKNNSTAVPETNFKHLISASSFDFEAGMKLEVPNQDSSSTYWLATVIAKSGPLILLRYEGYQDDNSADFWCNSRSSEIHPVGWCAKTKHALRPPKAIQHKEKSWYDYLIKNLTGARKAAEHLFNKRQSPIDKLGVGMMLEVIDKEDPKFYWIAIISEIYAGRLRLQYKGTDDATGEIWSYYLNERLFEPGHGFVYGLAMRPPRDVLKKISEKVWPNPKLERQLMTCWERDLLSQLLMVRPKPEEHAFRIGMKLEAKDPVNASNICCATVARVFDKHHFLVRIDNLLSSSVHEDRSFICHKKSHGIYPVGWCHKFNLPLNPPKGFNGHFTWKAYLQMEKAIVAPDENFDLNPVEHEIKVGMKLEAVDQENTANICVATVTQVLGRDVWIMFDGESRSEQIFDVRSNDIFPVGWCEMSGHELQWPRPSMIVMIVMLFLYVTAIAQKNRISRLRSTSERKTRLDHLRKGSKRSRKLPLMLSANNVPGSTQNSDEEKELRHKKRKRKAVKSLYYKGCKKRIKQKQALTSSSDEDLGYVDPTISYVFIRELTRNLNTEEEIKRGFNLDDKGNIPASVITIDSDDDEDAGSNKKMFNQKEMEFFSTLKIVPKDMTKEQLGQFNSLVGFKHPLSEKKSNALNTLVERIRSNQTHSRLQLIDFYHRQKRKQLRTGDVKERRGNTRPLPRILSRSGSKRTEEPNKENCRDNNDEYSAKRVYHHPLEGRPTMIRAVDNTAARRNLTPTSVDSDDTTEGAESNNVANGLYRVVENSIVDKKEESKKIVMKIAKPVDIKESKLNGLTEHSLLLDGYSPARDIPAIDEEMTAKCSQVKLKCKNIPKNPLSWTKHHVAEFVTAAGCGKHSKIFLNEEIDGHAFLLLTLNELHNLMGISVGPAVKLTDYIHTLQRETNRTPKVSGIHNNHHRRFVDQPRGTDPSKIESVSSTSSSAQNTQLSKRSRPIASSQTTPKITGVYRLSGHQFANLQQR
eukprot:gene6132-6840_t